MIYALEEVPELRDVLAVGVSPDSLPAMLSGIRGTTGLTRALDRVKVHTDLAKSQASTLPHGERLEDLVDEVLTTALTRLS